MRVAIAARNPDKPALQAREKANGVQRYACDASDPDSVDRLFRSVGAALGIPTLVVHNVGGQGTSIVRKSIADVEPGIVLDAIHNLALSALLVGQQAARRMRENKPNAHGVKGTIIFTNASAASKGFP